VLFGWLVGALLVWAYIRLESSVAERMRQKSTGWQVITVFGVSLLILLLGVLARLSLGAWAIPTDWLENAARAAPGSDPPDPLALAGLVLNAGAFFGLVTGYILLLTAGGFDAQGQWWKRLLRFPIGVLGVVLLWLGLGAVFPSGEYLLAYVLRYLRYALIGAWISALAPLIFIRLGLAKAANPRLVWKFRDGWREYSDR
jgi:hypothetical protein